MRNIKLAAVGLFWLVLPASATACPECSAQLRAEVRRGIFEDGFGFNLFATVLPFGIFLGITALIHSGFPSLPIPSGPDRPARRPR